jgi:ribosome-binding factor A
MGMANSRRQQQVASLILEIVSELLQRKAKDPRLGFITVTRVEVSPDLRHAKLLVSVLGSPEEREQSLAALEHSLPFLRRELAHRLELRYVPELTVKFDPTIEYSTRIAELLHQASPDRSHGGNDRG